MKQKKDIIKSLALHKKDVGSTAIQIGLLSNKIQKLSEHFKKFKKINTLQEDLLNQLIKGKGF